MPPTATLDHPAATFPPDPPRSRLAEISPCPACTNTLFKKLFTKKGRDFWRCTTCGLVKQFPLPTLDELRAYYDRSYSAGLYQTFADAADMKRLTARWRMNEILPHCRAGRWLDVGCSNGPFVAEALHRGFHAEGIELSEVAVAHGRSRGLPLFCSTLDDWHPPDRSRPTEPSMGHAFLPAQFSKTQPSVGQAFLPAECPTGRYDTLTSFDVLEHVLDPFAYLRSAHRLLAPGGTLALTVPNHSSLIRLLMGRRWYFYIPEEHLHYFNPANARLLLARAGFHLLRSSPIAKPLTYRYSLSQFEEYNPLIAALLRPLSKLLPRRVLDHPIPLPIGELLLISRRA